MAESTKIKQYFGESEDKEEKKDIKSKRLRTSAPVKELAEIKHCEKRSRAILETKEKLYTYDEVRKMIKDVVEREKQAHQREIKNVLYEQFIAFRLYIQDILSKKSKEGPSYIS